MNFKTEKTDGSAMLADCYQSKQDRNQSHKHREIEKKL